MGAAAAATVASATSAATPAAPPVEDRGVTAVAGATGRGAPSSGVGVALAPSPRAFRREKWVSPPLARICACSIQFCWLIRPPREPQRLADARDVRLHPGRDLLVAVDALLVERGLGRRIDEMKALQVLRSRRGGRDGCRRRRRPPAVVPRIGRETGFARALRDLGQRIDTARGRHGALGRLEHAAPHEAGESGTQNIGRRHQQQGLDKQRYHHAPPARLRCERPQRMSCSRNSTSFPSDATADLHR
ncbi:hypothetical protein [Methylomagnum sp.]